MVWLLLVTASAVATTNYLFDPNGESWSGWTCFGLLVASWATVVLAWRRHRSYLRRWSGGLTFFVIVLELLFVSILRNVYFPCAPLPPSGVERDKIDLVAAVAANNLPAVQTALVHINDPDNVNVPCHDWYGRSGNLPNCGWHERPLETAVRGGYLQIAAVLIDHGASVDQGDPAPLVTATTHNDLAMMRLLLHHGASASAGNFGSPLQRAIQYGNADAVVMLLRCGASPNETYSQYPDQDESWSALRLARKTGNIPVIKALLHAGANEKCP